MRTSKHRARWALSISILGLGCAAGELKGDGVQPGGVQPTHIHGSTPPAGPVSDATPNPPQQQGARACSAFDERASKATGDWTPWSGCTCTPDSPRLRDREHCGMFPCAEQGCYVQPCKTESDCTVGMCAGFLGRPHGYCVTDDPK